MADAGLCDPKPTIASKGAARWEVRKATADDIAAFCGPNVAVIVRADVALLDGRIVAIGGLGRRPPGKRIWGFFDIVSGLPAALGLRAVRALWRGLRQHGGPVHIQCVNGERLLRVLGFKPIAEYSQDRASAVPKKLRVWKWVE